MKHGVTISEMGFVDPFYAYYDSKLLKRRSPHVPLDRVWKRTSPSTGGWACGSWASIRRACRARSTRTHPEWRRIATNTTEIPQVDLKQFPHGGMLCLLGPYGDFFIDVLAESHREVSEVDAFSFDGLHYGGVCYCEHCRENFRKDTGGEIPDVNLDDPAFRRYQHWADRRMEDLIRRMQTRLKGIKPDVALVTWTTNAGRFGHFRDIPRNMPARMNLLLDAPDQEFWLDETNRGATIVPAFANAYIWACTNHRVAFSEPYLMSHGNPYGKDSFPGHEIERRMMLALTYGAGAEHRRRPAEAAAGRALRGLGRSAEAQAVAHAQAARAVGCDADERQHAQLLRPQSGPGRRALPGQRLRHVSRRGRRASAGHGDQRLEPDRRGPREVQGADPAEHRLPDDAQVPPSASSSSSGGGLVASLDTSLFDEFGDPRKNFALADVLGVQHAGVVTADAKPEELDVNFAKGLDASYWEKRKSTFGLRLNTPSPSLSEGVTPRNATEGVPYSALGDPRLAKLAGTDALIFKGPAVRIHSAEGAETLARLWPHGTPEQADSPPAVVTRSFGQGRVVYFAAGIDAGYFTYPYPYQRVLLASAIRWAASGPPPLEVKAPMCVHATLYRQTENRKDRLLVHLFNDVNTTAHHGLPNDDVPLREETLPIHDIRLTLRAYDLRSATQQPEGKSLAIAREGDITTLTVPRIDVHSIIVLELADSQSKP